MAKRTTRHRPDYWGRGRDRVGEDGGVPGPGTGGPGKGILYVQRQETERLHGRCVGGYVSCGPHTEKGTHCQGKVQTSDL